MLKIYFDDRPLIITKKRGKDKLLKGDLVYYFKNSEQLFKMVYAFESLKSFDRMIVYHHKPDEIIYLFEAEFKYIVAAGGVVFNQKKEILSILRRNAWDLPKGKADDGESIEETAVREVREECGINDLIIKKKLKPTYHTYWLKDKLVLKKTYWFKMKHISEEVLVPQTAEEIIEAKWFKKKDLDFIYNHTYKSVKDVLDQVV